MNGNIFLYPLNTILISYVPTKFYFVTNTNTVGTRMEHCRSIYFTHQLSRQVRGDHER